MSSMSSKAEISTKATKIEPPVFLTYSDYDEDAGDLF